MKKIINDEQLALHDFNMINHGLTDKATKIFHSNNFKSKQISIFDIFYFFLILTIFIIACIIFIIIILMNFVLI